MNLVQRLPATPAPGAVDGADAVILLGMHRSGTSCLTGSLQERGLYLGEVQEANPHNRKGNRESLRIMHLNNAVLAHSDGAWDCPPAQLSWTQEQADERDAIIPSLRADASGPWGFKDPRTVLTLDFWRQALPGARLVGSFRHPAQVARSLYVRSRCAPEQAFALWCAYNAHILRAHAAAPFPLISFDLEPFAYQRALDHVARALGLAAGTGEDAFFDVGLRTSAAPPEMDVPEDALAIYDALLRAGQLAQ
jgi:hypothetical protein